MRANKDRFVVCGVRGQYLIDSLREAVIKYTGVVYGETVDVSFIVGSLMDFTTWCTDVKHLKHDPVELLTDMNIPQDIAKTIYANMLEEVKKIHVEAIAETRCENIVESYINSRGFMTLVLKRKDNVYDSTKHD